MDVVIVSLVSSCNVSLQIDRIDILNTDHSGGFGHISALPLFMHVGKIDVGIDDTLWLPVYHEINFATLLVHGQMPSCFLVAFPPINSDIIPLLISSSSSPHLPHGHVMIVLLASFVALLFLPKTADDEEEEDEHRRQAAADGGVENGGGVEMASRLRFEDDAASGLRPVSRAALRHAGLTGVVAGAREIARGAVRENSSTVNVLARGGLTKRGQSETAGIEDTFMVLELAIAEFG